MYEKATVINIESHNKVRVGCRSGLCGQCHASTFCSSKNSSFLAKNSEGLPVKVNDIVELYLPPGKTIWAGFMALIVPLILFPIGYGIPHFLGSSSETIKIVSGIVGIFIGFTISGIFSRVAGNSYMPHITKILEHHE